VYEELPKLRAGHKELAPFEPSLAESRHLRLVAVAGERDMVDRAAALRHVTAGPEGRAARVDVDDGRAARQRDAKPGAGIAEIRARDLEKPQNARVEGQGGWQVARLDRDVKQAGSERRGRVHDGIVAAAKPWNGPSSNENIACARIVPSTRAVCPPRKH
jgi:hypothetical protein